MSEVPLRRFILGGLFILPFVPLFVSGSFFFPFITTKAFVWRAAVELVFGAWVILAAIAPEYRPKKGVLLYALLAFLLIVGVADFTGVAPIKSFWSNFERMEGYVLMLHLGALFLVMSSVFGSKEWKWWWNTSLVASAFMVVYCFFQLMGAVEIHQGGVRVDGTIGNAAYLALYMLFHIFVASYYFLKSRKGLRYTYGLLILAELFVLYKTATRGAILGLIGAAGIVAILNLFNKENKKAKKISGYILGGLAVVVIGFWMVRGTSFVAKSEVLSRFSNLSLSEWKSEGRSFIWPMALKGIKDKPLLGWGQDNFNYVFSKYYSPEMYGLEPWFDRAHNVFLDWGIAAGILGLLAYLSFYIFALWGIWKKGAFDFTEKTLLTGLVAAYFFNNLFIFDNLISYTLFFALLAYIHSRTGVVWGKNWKPMSEKSSLVLAAPVSILIILILYFVVAKPVIGNTDLIFALEANNGNQMTTAMSYFEKAYNSSRLGQPEEVEWISSTADRLLLDNTISQETRMAYYQFAQNAIENTTANSVPDDPRAELVAGGFYLSLGQADDALKHFQKAQSLMPEKQQIYYSLGQAYYLKKDYPDALAAFKKAYDLDTSNEQAKEIYTEAQKQIPH